MRVALPRPPAVDAALAAGLAVLVLWEVFATDVTGAKAVVVPAALCMTLPLAWRRRAPLAVTAVMATAVVAQALLDRTEQEPQTPLIALLVLAFSVGAYGGGAREARIGLALVVGALVADEPGDFVVMGPVHAAAWATGRLLHARQLEAEASRDRAAELERERDQAREAVSEERARIARELHDVVAHNVSVMVIQAGAERLARPEAPAPTRETLESIERTGREALVEMHRLLGVLREDDEGIALAPQPSLARLEELAAIVRGAGLPVELAVEGEPQELPPGVDISAYRIVQEALTNALRHAGPARARVLVRYGAQQLEIEVVDDGRSAVAPNGSGHGLAGMRERVAIYGGELTAGAGAEGGFSVRARLPLPGTAP